MTLVDSVEWDRLPIISEDDALAKRVQTKYMSRSPFGGEQIIGSIYDGLNDRACILLRNRDIDFEICRLEEVVRTIYRGIIAIKSTYSAGNGSVAYELIARPPPASKFNSIAHLFYSPITTSFTYVTLHMDRPTLCQSKTEGQTRLAYGTTIQVVYTYKVDQIPEYRRNKNRLNTMAANLISAVKRLMSPNCSAV